VYQISESPESRRTGSSADAGSGFGITYASTLKRDDSDGRCSACRKRALIRISPPVYSAINGRELYHRPLIVLRNLQNGKSAVDLFGPFARRRERKPTFRSARVSGPQAMNRSRTARCPAREIFDLRLSHHPAQSMLPSCAIAQLGNMGLDKGRGFRNSKNVINGSAWKKRATGNRVCAACSETPLPSPSSSCCWRTVR